MSDGYGVTPNGFVRMRFPECKADILAAIRNSTGKDISGDETTLIGQIVNVAADRMAAAWERSEAVYHAMYPGSAEGVNLDNVVAFTGVRRLQASSTMFRGILYGVPQTVVPINAVVRSVDTLQDYQLSDIVVIQASNACDYIFNVATVTPNSSYKVVVNGVSYTYTAGGSPAAEDIALSLSVAIKKSGLITSVTGSQIRVYNPDLQPFSIDASSDSKFAFVRLGSPGEFYSTAYGPAVPEIGTVTNIITMVSGWNSVINPIEAVSGRYTETDEDLRVRYQLGPYVNGAATVPAIKANLLENVPGILSCAVYFNKTNAVDSSNRPPHTVEAVIYGGNETDIVNQLANLVAGGIDTYGNVSAIYRDSQNVPMIVQYSRPETKFVWIKYALTKYSEEELPADVISRTTQAIVTLGESLGVGSDIIRQRFLGPIFEASSGIQTIDISFAVSGDPLNPPAASAYITGNIPIGERERASFDAFRIDGIVNP